MTQTVSIIQVIRNLQDDTIFTVLRLHFTMLSDYLVAVGDLERYTLEAHSLSHDYPSPQTDSMTCSTSPAVISGNKGRLKALR